MMLLSHSLLVLQFQEDRPTPHPHLPEPQQVSMFQTEDITHYQKDRSSHIQTPNSHTLAQEFRAIHCFWDCKKRCILDVLAAQ